MLQVAERRSLPLPQLHKGRTREGLAPIHLGVCPSLPTAQSQTKSLGHPALPSTEVTDISAVLEADSLIPELNQLLWSSLRCKTQAAGSSVSRRLCSTVTLKCPLPRAWSLYRLFITKVIQSLGPDSKATTPTMLPRSSSLSGFPSARSSSETPCL